MRKAKTGTIALNKIKHVANSRMRDNDDVGDLMEDIQQRGLLQPVGIRQKDNALIFGNRRVKAYEKLGYKEIECEYFVDVEDDDLLIMNIVENIKRKNIGSIEIGRICKMLMEKGMTQTEIASKLKITKARVSSCVASYNITVNTPFESLVTFKEFGNNKGIPESVIWKIQTNITRARKLTKNDWNVILGAIESGELTLHHIAALRKILMSDKKISMTRALDILKKCKVYSVFLRFDEKELNKELLKQKLDSPNELIKSVLKKHNPNLLF